VLSRKYGDCKDKATLLVGLLRALGVEAHVALLSMGPGLDLDPELPGMGGFDHAIVHVGGDDPLWIDATSDYAELGTLPAADEDRLSLIAAATTRGLVRTPASSADANRYLESVRVDFTDLGNARLTERTEARGVPAQGLRASADAPKGTLLQKWKKYAQDRYSATLSDVSAQNVRDTSAPVELRLDLTDSSAFASTDAGAEVEVPPRAILGWLPEQLLQDPNESKPKPDARYREPESFPLYITTPHDVRIEYRLGAPDGFVWDDLPEPLDLSGHGVQMTRTLERLDDREVAVRFRVRSDARRIAAEDLPALGELARSYDKRASVSLRYVHAASRAIERGDLAGGLALHRSLIERAPGVPAPALRYARELLGLGFGISARRIVDGVLAQHPDHAAAHAASGWLARYDPLGREGRTGSDLTRARASYRRAVELAPDNHGYQVELARLLMHAPGARGFVEFGSGAPLDEAARALRKLHEGSAADHESHGTDLVRLLTRQGKFGEASELAASLRDPEPVRAHWIAAVAATKGASDAERLAYRLAPDGAAEELRKAAVELVASRRYAEAAALGRLEISRRTSAWDPRLLETLSFAADQERCRAQLHPAARVVLEWINRKVAGMEPPEPTQSRRWRPGQPVSDARALEDFARGLSERSTHPPAPVIYDSGWCRAHPRADELGSWVRVGQAIETPAPITFYLRRERKDDYRLAGMDAGADSYASLLALRALRAKRYDEAHTFLRWANENFQPRQDFQKKVKALFKAEMTPADRPDLDIAIAAFAALASPGRLDAGEIEQARQILTAASAVENLDPQRKAMFAFAQARLALLESPERGAQAFAALHEASPENEEIWVSYFAALGLARNYKDLVPLLNRRLENRTERDPVWPVLTYAQLEIGQFESALERVKTRRERGIATPGELNQVAWAALFVGSDLAQAAELASAAVQTPGGEGGDSKPSAGILNTLAVLRAELGEYTQARSLLEQGLEASEDREVSTGDWYLVGRIAEGLGLPADAEAAYARIPKPEGEASSFNVWELAEKRRRSAGL
jgi:tetratricopeptide (TPR) repeat protein